MKIAYCITGHLRAWSRNTTLLENLIKPNPGDVFLHTYPVLNFSGGKWHTDDGNAWEGVTMFHLIDLINSFGNVQAVEVDRAETGRKRLPPELANMGFLWGRQAVCELRKTFQREKPDVVFVGRYDLGFREPFAFPEEIDKDTIYGGYNRNQEMRGADGEVFFYGSPEAVDKLCVPCWDEAMLNEARDAEFHGEMLFTKLRVRRGLHYRQHKIKHFLYRSTGEVDIEQ